MGAFDVRDDRPVNLPKAILSDQLLTDTLYFEASKHCLEMGRAYKQAAEERRRKRQELLEQQQKLAAASAARAKATLSQNKKSEVSMKGTKSSQPPDGLMQWERHVREAEELVTDENGKAANKKRNAESGAVATLEMSSPFEFPRGIRHASGELKSHEDGHELEINLSQEEIRELFGTDGFEPKSIVDAMRDIVARMDSHDRGLDHAQDDVAERKLLLLCSSW